jgi:carbon-monoxide dehydrogenase large subunit
LDGGKGHGGGTMAGADGTRAAGWIGQSLRRREDAALLRGAGRFMADIAPAGALRLVFLRADAAGRIAALDTAAAAASPGVRLILTGADFAGAGSAAVNLFGLPARPVPMEPLARGRARAVGQAVAAIVAETEAEARDAAEAIGLSLDAGADEVEVVLDFRRSAGEAAPAVAEVAARVDHALVAPMALEPRGALAAWDGTQLTAHLCVQTPHRARDDLAAVLRLDPGQVRVITPDIGGAFGAKAGLAPEDVVVALAAMRLGAPVLWLGTRSEEFLSATQGRGMRTGARAAIDGAGRLAALAVEVAAPLGHWMPASTLAALNNAQRIPPGPYAVPRLDVTLTGSMTPGAAVSIYRGAGRPEAAMILERVMDRAAAAAGQDPLAFRRANLAPVSPQGAASPALAASLEAIGPAWDAAKAWRDAARAAGSVAGAGLAVYTEPCGQGWEWAEVAVTPRGIVARTGATAQGQGRATAAAQIVADPLGLHPDAVRVVFGDTAEVAEGMGAFASRATAIGGSALLAAARGLAEAARGEAARRMNCAAEAVRLGPEGATGPGGTIPWPALAPLAVAERYTPEAEAWAGGAVVAEVTLDPETGAVSLARIVWAEDAGTVVNPMLVEGQLIGGAAQGIGAALMERIVYDADGQLLTGSLMDYAMPRAADMPPFAILSVSTPTAANSLGARGVGEAGTVGVPAAILNAVMDALPPGTPDLPLPLTSERVWRALHGMDPC